MRIDIEGDRAVAFRDVAAADRLGPPFFPVDVKVSAARDALSIDIRDSRGWPAIDPAKPNRFAAEAWSPLATGEVYFDELQP